jgi:hypothetical protein
MDLRFAGESELPTSRTYGTTDPPGKGRAWPDRAGQSA